MPLTIPNLLTSFRIVAIPLVVLIYYLPADWAGQAAGVLFGLAAITDWFDGFLARKLDQTSRFGEFLDPIADKLLVSTSLIVLLHNDPTWYLALFVAIIIGREIAVSALREWMSQLGSSAAVKVTYFAKWKTTLQMFGIGFMLYQTPSFGIPVYPIGQILLAAAAGLTLWSMVEYVKASWPTIAGNE